MKYEVHTRKVEPWPKLVTPGFVCLYIVRKEIFDGGFVEDAYCVSKADAKIVAQMNIDTEILDRELIAGKPLDQALKAADSGKRK